MKNNQYKKFSYAVLLFNKISIENNNARIYRISSCVVSQRLGWLLGKLRALLNISLSLNSESTNHVMQYYNTWKSSLTSHWYISIVCLLWIPHYIATPELKISGAFQRHRLSTPAISESFGEIVLWDTLI